MPNTKKQSQEFTDLKEQWRAEKKKWHALAARYTAGEDVRLQLKVVCNRMSDLILLMRILRPGS